MKGFGVNKSSVRRSYGRYAALDRTNIVDCRQPYKRPPTGLETEASTSRQQCTLFQKIFLRVEIGVLLGRYAASDHTYIVDLPTALQTSANQT